LLGPFAEWAQQASALRCQPEPIKPYTFLWL